MANDQFPFALAEVSRAFLAAAHRYVEGILEAEAREHAIEHAECKSRAETQRRTLAASPSRALASYKMRQCASSRAGVPSAMLAAPSAVPTNAVMRMASSLRPARSRRCREAPHIVHGGFFAHSVTWSFLRFSRSAADTSFCNLVDAFLMYSTNSLLRLCSVSTVPLNIGSASSPAAATWRYSASA